MEVGSGVVIQAVVLVDILETTMVADRAIMVEDLVIMEEDQEAITVVVEDVEVDDTIEVD